MQELRENSFANTDPRAGLGSPPTGPERQISHSESRRLSAPHAQDQDHSVGGWVIAGAIGFLAGVALNPTRKAVLQTAEAATGDWYDILKAEHKGVEKAFDALLKTGPQDKRKRQMLLTQIAHALNKHAMTEENVIYPALRKHDLEAAKELGSEHLDIKADLAALQYDLEKDEPAWIETARKLRDEVVEHARDEEERIFPPFRASLSDEENASLNRRLHWEGLKIA
ncbi:MAG: hemerythrin domain-containing protein [Parvularcula sp.]|jgi:hemerythrin superfamily protein|nr:hemerythrin domain-containing protein [Parvularcula sp.]